MNRDFPPEGLLPVADFDGARRLPAPLDRLRALRRCARQFRERFLDAPPVFFAASFNLLRVPYPAWYAFSGVYSQQLLKPHLIHLLARVAVIQFKGFDGRARTLLFTPADFEAGAQTPYFKRMAEHTPRTLRGAIAPVHATVLQALEACGIAPDEVDYISYDHLHTQDVRRWLGNAATPGLFPNAKLVVHRQELASVNALLPIQADWYCPNGLDGVPACRRPGSWPSTAASSLDMEWHWSIRLGIRRATIHWSTGRRTAFASAVKTACRPTAGRPSIRATTVSGASLVPRARRSY